MGHAEVVAAQQRLAEEEGDEAGDQRDREDHAREHGQLAPTRPAGGAARRSARSGSCPVLYSPLVTSTPSTPKATTAKAVPVRLVVTGLKQARSAALNVWYWLAVTAENSAPMPIISTTRGQQRVDGGPQGAELGQLGAQHPGLGDLQRGPAARGGGTAGSGRRSSDCHRLGGHVRAEVNGVVGELHECLLQRRLLAWSARRRAGGPARRRCRSARRSGPAHAGLGLLAGHGDVRAEQQVAQPDRPAGCAR